MRKVKNKRTSFWEKAWYIIKPFLVYMIVKSFVMLLLAVFIPALPVPGMDEWVEINASLLSAVVNGVASLIGAGFLLNDFLKEVTVAGEVDIDAGIPKQLISFFKKGFFGYTSGNGAGLAICAGLGMITAFALNLAIEAVFMLLNVGSEKYNAVETIQYSVPLWLGVILYGLVSPIAEELVFRGVIYNRMKRFYSVPCCVILTALLFGAFHANLPQFVYGTCMGILMALCYEKVQCFAAPVIFHMAANVFVFLLSFL